MRASNTNNKGNNIMANIDAQYMGLAQHFNTGNGAVALLDHDGALRFFDLVENAQVFATEAEAIEATQAAVDKLAFRDDIVVSALAIPPVA